MTSATAKASIQNSVVAKDGKGTSPIPRCVSTTNTAVGVNIKCDDEYKLSMQPKRSRKRPRPGFENGSASMYPPLCFISTEVNDEDKQLSNEDNFPRRASFFSNEKACKGTETVRNIAGTTMKYSPSSPVRSVVSCDADATDENSQSPEFYRTPAIGISEETRSTLHEKEFDTLNVPSFGSLVNEAANGEFDILQLHIQAVEAESLLLPLRSLLSRLMAHPTYNRKGTFNAPVDYISLGLKDYTTMVKTPMDLGTIKGLLHANSYLNHNDVAKDIRLVFNNGQLYNPPSHPIHEAAKNLLRIFEDGFSAIYITKVTVSDQNIQRQNSETKAGLNSPPILLPMKNHVTPPSHTCQSCLGSLCPICKKGCLSLEPTLLICTGPGCTGLKIRRGVNYYCSTDGTKAWCQKCYSSLPAILPAEDEDLSLGKISYKRDLLKRRNDEDAVERWVKCVRCDVRMHEICAFTNEFSVNKESFVCPLCLKSKFPFQDMSGKFEITSQIYIYSFVSGESMPQKIRNVTKGTSFDAGSLPSCSISKFIEEKVCQRMLRLSCPSNAEKTLTVRIISDCDKFFRVPEVVRRHFRMSSSIVEDENPSYSRTEQFKVPPLSVHYKSKAIAMFQRIDGIDVCIFCMYVQEYDDVIESNQRKRVYIAYLDSVEYFQPRALRTTIYHEILVSYLATARVRGYEFAHIWSCPPSRGNSFVFWSHPATQRTPNREHLLSWYHTALSQAVSCGVVTQIQSLYDFSFQKCDDNTENSMVENDACIMMVPPLLEGDFWMEEAARVHSTSIVKFMKSKKLSSSHCGEDRVLDEALQKLSSNCPVMHVITLLLDVVMTHSSALPFCRPVNAAALKLRDYHDIIKRPMDLGTVHLRCLLGEYEKMKDFLIDVELVFSNAMTYNPKGHLIHIIAEKMWEFTRRQLNSLVKYWRRMGVCFINGIEQETVSYEDYGEMSMRLGSRITSKDKKEQNHFEKLKLPKPLHEGLKDSLRNAASSYQVSPKIDPQKSSLCTPAKTVTKSNCLPNAPDEIAQSMVGNDFWLLKKRGSNYNVSSKNKKKKRTKSSLEDTAPIFSHHKRTESWLGDEVAATVRRLRTDFFVCHLLPKHKLTNAEKEKIVIFSTYVAGLKDQLAVSKESTDKKRACVPPGVADARSCLLEFSQYRNFQFDTIRRAKYSTALLLYYLKNPSAPGLIPTCTSCQRDIINVRWHRVKKAFDERRRNSLSFSVSSTCIAMDREDLCSQCYSDTSQKDIYIPIRVSPHVV